jgi:hypothetical protein
MTPAQQAWAKAQAAAKGSSRRPDEARLRALARKRG